MQQLNGQVKVTRAMLAVAAGSADENGSIIDMQNYEGVLFIAQAGTITASSVSGLKAQQGAIANMSDAADLLGSLVSFADSDDDDCVVLDIYRPTERYVRPVFERATANCVIDGVIAIQYGAKKMPVTHDAATVIGSETHASPAEGTA